VTRRELGVSLLRVLGAGALLAACGGDDTVTVDAATIGNCNANGTTVRISANHGHVLVVSIDDVMAGADKTYDIMGTAAHTHLVTVTADQFAMLQTNHSINTTSTVASSHSHGIVVMCA
jgi:hypothetical protein